MLLLLFNLVLSGVRVVKSGVVFSDLVAVHLSGDEGVALSPQLVVPVSELLADPVLSWLLNGDLIERSAAFVLKSGKGGLLGVRGDGDYNDG